MEELDAKAPSRIVTPFCPSVPTRTGHSCLISHIPSMEPLLLRLDLATLVGAAPLLNFLPLLLLTYILSPLLS